MRAHCYTRFMSVLITIGLAGCCVAVKERHIQFIDKPVRAWELESKLRSI